MLSGSLFDIEIDNGKSVEKVSLDNDQFIGLSRVAFSVGFRFGY